ncbi:MAG: NTP transferase domain-containing protein, partial [Theionarchaea archaeon]|nr:NTP transferase domain-containing protein [Theionarchaea archaeon]
PKSLLPVAGIPIIDYIVEKISCDEIVVSINRKFEGAFRKWKSEYCSQKDIQFFVEETYDEKEKLGTLGALAYFIEKENVEEDLLVVAGDNVFEFDVSDFLNHFAGSILIALHDMKDLQKVKGRYGVAILKEGKICSFEEKPEVPRSTLVSTGIYMFPRKVLPLFSEFLLRERDEGTISEKGKDAPGYFIEWILEHENVDGFPFEGSWYDIGDRTSYIRANMGYGLGTYVGKGCTIERSTLEESVILDHVTAVDCTIQRSVIDEDCELEGVTLVESIVGAGSRIRKC